MAKWQIQTPGGYEVEVTADTESQALDQARQNWQTMPRIIGKQGDTRIFERANGQRYLVSPGYSTTDPQRIQQALEGATAGEISRESIDLGLLEENIGAARAGEFARGSMLGSYADEAIGKMRGPNAQAGMRMLSGAMQRQRPGETLALNLAGGLTEAGAAAVAAPAALARAGGAIVGQGPRMAQIARGAGAGAAFGAGQGAVYGAGEGTDAATRASEAARGSGVGALFGGAFGAGAPLVGEAVGNVVGRLRRSDVRDIASELNISQDAAKVIKQTFSLGGSVEDAAQALRRAGEEGMLADAGVAMRVLLDASATAGPVPAQTVSTAIGERVARSGEKLTDELDFRLGFPTGVETLKGGIRRGSQPARQAAYDAALSQEIDWRSPAGERLRGLLQTTPSEVMSRAQRSQSMAIQPDDMSRRYADEFAPTVQTGSAASQARAAEQAEVEQFFSEYADAARNTGRKRPFTSFIQSRGGIDPKGPAAAELRARGITSRTHPGLYRVGGMKDVDNLPLSEFDVEGIRYGGGQESGRYAETQEIYDAIESEGFGVPVGSSENAEQRSRLLELDALLPEYEARRAALQSDPAAAITSAPQAVSDIAPMATVSDVDQVKRALDDIYRTNDGLGLLGGATDFGRLAGLRSRAIRDALAEAVPEYSTALKTAADPIRRVGAVDFGSKVLDQGTPRESVREFVQGATGGEMMAAKEGLRSQIDEIMANVRAVASNPDQDAREAVAAVNRMNNRASREKMAMILGDDAPDFFRQLDEAAASFNLQADVAGNSRTALRRAVQEDVGETVAPGVVATAARGEAVDVAKRVVQGLTGMTDEFSAQQRQRVFNDIARALTEKTGEDARIALAVLDQAMKGQPLTDAQTNQLASLIAGSLFTSGTRAATTGYSNEARAIGPR